MSEVPWLWVENGVAAELTSLASVELKTFSAALAETTLRRLALMVIPGDGGVLRLLGLVADEGRGLVGLLSTEVAERYPSLTPSCPDLHLFERELWESWGLMPEGHPWLKAVRYPQRRHSGAAQVMPVAGTLAPWQVQGEGVHEVAVGPVHAGVIEPGHFRFQCHGEEVFHLEIALGYQHRGVERWMLEASRPRQMHFMETVAGDTSIGHATAHALVMEGLGGHEISPRASVLRGLALELERMANHTGDLGALAADVGFLPTSSFCGRLRGDLLNATAMLCGNRFGRGMVNVGGVGWDLDAAALAELQRHLRGVWRDIEGAVHLLLDTPSVLARFEGCGVLSQAQALQLGCVGPTARASGLRRDVRKHFPAGVWRDCYHSPAFQVRGDVLARAQVRWQELEKSWYYCQRWLEELPEGERVVAAAPGSRPRALCVGLVEGWRGEIVHVGVSNAAGGWAAYKVIDPSFRNWSALAMVMRGTEISDFPLCNKSFNLSYCGFDL